MPLASPRSPEVLSSVPAPPFAGAIDWPELHRRHDRRVRLAVVARLRQLGLRIDPERVEELAQEVWCRLLERDRARRPGPRAAREAETAEYLRRVARSVVIDAWRNDRAAKRNPGSLHSLDSIDGGDSCADSRGCPLRRAQARDQLRDFLRHCRRLLGPRSPRDRFAAVRLVWVDGLTSPEAARALGGRWTAGAVDCLLMRLRRRLSANGLEAPVRPRDARS